MAYIRVVESDSELEVAMETGKPSEGTNLVNSDSNHSGPKDMADTKKPYPKGVFFVVGNEFCERFSYYGMRTILVLYLTDWLRFNDDDATAIYHFFIVLCYMSPLVGAIIADGFWGKYKTIYYVSIFYCIGNILMSLTAFPPPNPIGPIIALILIGLGTGGIKPCVSAFGGDQFSSDQVKETAQFFSIFYFAINLGSLLSTIATPLIRQNVQCFNTNCFPLAFGIPAILMVVSLVLFVCGKRLYKIYPPTGNVIGQMCMCIGRAIKNKCKSSEKKEHWLDYASDKYDASFLYDVRCVLRVFLMFLPLPIFWALFDQQGSRWILQAKKMDLVVGRWHVPPDLMQAINPVMIILFIPLFESCLYPMFERCNVLNKPLQRMVVGMFLACGAFIMAGFLQIKLDMTTSSVVPSDASSIQIINMSPCRLQTQAQWYNGTLGATGSSKHIISETGNYSASFSIERLPGSEACTTKLLTENKSPKPLDVELQPGKAYYVVVMMQNGKISAEQFDYKTKNPQPEQSLVGVLYLSDMTVNDRVNDTRVIWLTSDTPHKDTVSFGVIKYKQAEFKDVQPNSYTVSVPLEGSTEPLGTPLGRSFIVQNGGIYTLIIYTSFTDASKLDYSVYVDVPPNDVSVLYQIPQYIVITAGEILFSISGLSFAYSQAPASMKSVVQAGWLLTVAGGNIVDAVVAGIQLLPSQTAEFFFFATFMALVTVIFAIMSYFYQYEDHSRDFELQGDKEDDAILPGIAETETNDYQPIPSSVGDKDA